MDRIDKRRTLSGSISDGDTGNLIDMEKTFKRDAGGIRYAQRKLCEYIFVDITTGQIWQWSSDRFKQEKIAYLRGYPHMANCEVMSLAEYEEMCNKIESEQYDTGRNQ